MADDTRPFDISSALLGFPKGKNTEDQKPVVGAGIVAGAKPAKAKHQPMYGPFLPNSAKPASITALPGITDRTVPKPKAPVKTPEFSSFSEILDHVIYGGGAKGQPKHTVGSAPRKNAPATLPAPSGKMEIEPVEERNLRARARELEANAHAAQARGEDISGYHAALQPIYAKLKTLHPQNKQEPIFAGNPTGQVEPGQGLTFDPHEYARSQQSGLSTVKGKAGNQIPIGVAQAELSRAGNPPIPSPEDVRKYDIMQGQQAQRVANPHDTTTYTTEGLLGGAAPGLAAAATEKLGQAVSGAPEGWWTKDPVNQAARDVQGQVVNWASMPLMFATGEGALGLAGEAARGINSAQLITQFQSNPIETAKNLLSVDNLAAMFLLHKLGGFKLQGRLSENPMVQEYAKVHGEPVEHVVEDIQNKMTDEKEHLPEVGQNEQGHPTVTHKPTGTTVTTKPVNPSELNTHAAYGQPGSETAQGPVVVHDNGVRQTVIGGHDQVAEAQKAGTPEIQAHVVKGMSEPTAQAMGQGRNSVQPTLFGEEGEKPATHENVPRETTVSPGPEAAKPSMNENFLRSSEAVRTNDVNDVADGLPYRKRVTQNNLTAILPESAKVVYHETGLDGARGLINRLESGPRNHAMLDVSDNPDLALGQGGKGIRLELDPAKLNGVENRGKPGLEFTKANGGGSEYGIEKSVKGALRAIEGGKRQLDALAKEPWAKRFDFENPEDLGNGRFKVSRKSAPAITASDVTLKGADLRKQGLDELRVARAAKQTGLGAGAPFRFTDAELSAVKKIIKGTIQEGAQTVKDAVSAAWEHIKDLFPGHDESEVKAELGKVAAEHFPEEAKPEEPKSAGVGGTQADINARRAERGAPEIEKGNPANLAGIKGTYSVKGVSRMIEDPEAIGKDRKPLSASEATDLNNAQIYQDDVRRKAQQALADAVDRGATPEELKPLQQDADAAEKKLRQLEEADYRTGSSAGLTLRMRQEFYKAQHSYAGLVHRYMKLNDGKAPDPAARERLQKAANEVKRAGQDTPEETSKAKTQATEAVKRATSGRIVRRWITEDRYKEALSKVLAAPLGAGIDPALLKEAGTIVAYHIQEGAVKAEDLFNKAKDTLKGWSDADVWKAVHEGAKMHSSEMNMGRAFGEDIFKSGPNAIQDESIAQARQAADDLKREAAEQVPGTRENQLRILADQKKVLDQINQARQRHPEDLPALRDKLNDLRKRFQESADKAREERARKVSEPTPEEQERRKRVQAAERAADAEIRNMTPMTPGQRAWEFLGHLAMFARLTGLTTLEKLPTYSAERIAMQPLEDLATASLASLGKAKPLSEGKLGKLSAKAGYDLKGTALAQPDFYKGVFSRQALQEAAAVLKNNESNLERDFGTRLIPKDHGKIASIPGRIHGAEKAPLMLGEFKKSYSMRYDAAEKMGLDVTAPDVQDALRQGALSDSMDIILKGEGKLYKEIQGLIEASARKRGPEGSGAYRASIARGQLLYGFYRVGANLAERHYHALFGLPHAALKVLLTKEGRMTPEEARYTAKMAGRGAVGTAAMLAGWSMYDPDKDEKKPKNLATQLIDHTILGLAFNLGGDAHRRWDAAHKEKGSVLMQGFHGAARGIGHAGAEMSKEIPGNYDLQDFNNIMDSFSRDQSGVQGEKALETSAGNFARGVVIPQGIQQWAKARDVSPEDYALRDKSGLMNSFLSGWPGSRQNLPYKPKEAKARAEQEIRDMSASGASEDAIQAKYDDDAKKFKDFGALPGMENKAGQSRASLAVTSARNIDSVVKAWDTWKALPEFKKMDKDAKSDALDAIDAKLDRMNDDGKLSAEGQRVWKEVKAEQAK